MTKVERTANKIASVICRRCHYPKREWKPRTYASWPNLIAVARWHLRQMQQLYDSRNTDQAAKKFGRQMKRRKP